MTIDRFPRARTRLQLGWHAPPPHPRVPGFVQTDAPPPAVARRTRRRPWTLDDDESHLMTFGPTASGKGRSAILPTLLEYPGATIVVDPKGEAAAVTARRRREMGQRVVIIDPFRTVTGTPDTFNPLDVLGHVDMGVEEFALALPGMLHPDQDLAGHRDPFWPMRGDELIAGVAAYVLSVLPPEKRTLSEIRRRLKSGDVLYELARALDDDGGAMPALASENIGSIVSTEDRCRSGILATAQQHFAIFAEPQVETTLASTSFDCEALLNGAPMTVYLVLPVSRLKSHSALLRLWVGAILTLLKSRGGRPALPTLLLIDEVAQLGRLTELESCMTLMRGYGVRTWTFWQSLSQLASQYGPAGAATMMDNCGVMQVLGANHHAGARELAELCGEEVSAARILGLRRDEQIVLSRGGRAERIQCLDYLQDARYRGHHDPNPRHRLLGPEALAC